MDKDQIEAIVRNTVNSPAKPVGGGPSAQGNTTAMTPRPSAASGLTQEQIDAVINNTSQQPIPLSGEGFGSAVKQWGKDFIADTVGGLPSKEDMKEAFGDTSPFVSGLPIVGPLSTIKNTLDLLRNKDEDPSLLSTAADTIADGMSLGAANVAFAVTDAMEGVANGEVKDLSSFVGNLQDNLELRELELAESKAANPITGFMGTMIGGATTGGALAKGVGHMAGKYLPRFAQNLNAKWWLRAVTGGGIGAAETAVYDTVKGQDAATTGVDVAVAFIGGSALGAIAGEAVPALISRFRGKKPLEAIQEGIGDQVGNLFNEAAIKRGQPPLTPKQIEVEVAKLGPGATILDAFPNFMTLARQTIRNSGADIERARGLYTLLHSRNRIAEEILSPNGLLRNLGERRVVRTEGEFNRSMKRVFSSMSKRYSTILDNEGVKITAPVKDVQSRIDAAIVGMTAGERASSPLIDQQISATIGRYLTQVTKGQKATVKPGTIEASRAGKSINLAQLVGLRKQIDSWIGTKTIGIPGAKGQPVGIDRAKLPVLFSARTALNEVIRDIAPEALNKLDAVYGNNAGAAAAFRAGRSMVKDRTLDGDDFYEFINDPEKSQYQVRSFVEGVKSQLFESMKGARTARDFEKYLTENVAVIDKLKGMLGDDAVQKLLNEVNPAVRKLHVADQLAAESPRLQQPNTFGQGVSEAMDIGVVAGGAANQVSSAAALGGVKRLLNPTVDLGEQAMRDKSFDQLLSSQYGAGSLPARLLLEQLDKLRGMPIKPQNQRALGRDAMSSGFVGTGTSELNRDK